MKASAKTDKGQKSIASFFFKPKGSNPKAGQSQQQQQQKQHRVLGEKQAAQVPPPLAAPTKRQRLSEPIEVDTVNDERPMPSEPAHQSNAFVGVQDLHPASSHDASLVSTADMHAAQQQIPSRSGHRHQRFQQKLVIGAGNRAEGNLRGTAAVTKPKYTPLELQIVELKATHPGILLIVEVCSSSSPCLAICKHLTQLVLAQCHAPSALKAFFNYHFHVCQVGYKMRFFGEDAGAGASLNAAIVSCQNMIQALCCCCRYCIQRVQHICLS